MDSLLAELRHSLSWTRRSFRNQTMQDRRIPAALEGSEERRGPRNRGLWRGEEEMGVDLKNDLGWFRDEERERWAREAAWDGILTLLGWWASREEILGGRRKWVGRTADREREIEAVGGAIMASWVCSSDDWVSGFSRVWRLGSIFLWVEEDKLCLKLLLSLSLYFSLCRLGERESAWGGFKAVVSIV